MSSILDALNKLEQDKAQAQRRAEGYEEDPVSAAQELVGRSVLRDRLTFRFSPLTLIAGGLVGVAILVTFTFGLSLMIFRPSEQGAASAAESVPVPAAPTIEDSPSGEEPVVEFEIASVRPSDLVTPQESDRLTSEDQPPRAVQKVSERQEAPAVTDATTASPVPNSPSQDASVERETAVATPGPVPTDQQVVREVVTRNTDIRPASDIEAADIGPTPVEDEAPAQTPTREFIARAPEPGSAAIERPLHLLPELTPAISSRYADDPLKLNMCIPANDTNPYGFALINRIKVYEGQRISGSRLQLFEVVEDGIGVRVIGTGERYFLPH